MTPYIAEEFVQTALAELVTSQGWKQEFQNDKVTLFINSHVQVGSFKECKGIKIHGKVSIPFEALCRVMQEIEHRQQWDQHTEINKRIVLNEDEELIYNWMKSPNRLLFSTREFVIARRKIKELNSNNKSVVYFIGKSIEDERFPIQSKGVVRGTMHMQVIRVEEINEKECNVQFLTCMELGGSAPAFIMGMISKKMAENYSESLYKGYQYIKSLQ